MLLEDVPDLRLLDPLVPEDSMAFSFEKDVVIACSASGSGEATVRAILLACYHVSLDVVAWIFDIVVCRLLLSSRA